MYRLFLLILLVSVFQLHAQEALRFENEVRGIHKRDSIFNLSQPIVFAGSSTINNWKDITTAFPEHTVVNHGFGGSEMSDLLYYTNTLLIDPRPSQIFIYEGDNDLSRGKTTEVILADAGRVLAIIREKLPRKLPVVFLTAKPSLSRWKLKEHYEAYNKALKKWAKKQRKVKVVDVWKPMLDENGEPMKDIFLEDGLHMNKKGYDIWTRTLRPYLKNKRKR